MNTAQTQHVSAFTSLVACPIYFCYVNATPTGATCETNLAQGRLKSSHRTTSTDLGRRRPPPHATRPHAAFGRGLSMGANGGPFKNGIRPVGRNQAIEIPAAVTLDIRLESL